VEWPVTIAFTLDGRDVTVEDEGCSLAEALRDRLGVSSVKDGCSPQGQCGCCTVLVDGQPRVSCVTPVRRAGGRAVTTVDGLALADREAWAEAFLACGASQCGFCTPGIVVRLEALRARGTAAGDRAAVGQALLAHLCRCTGWRTIFEAWDRRNGPGAPDGATPGGARTAATAVATDRHAGPQRDAAAARRAALEGGTPQLVASAVALGQGGFADDTAPADALVAVPDGRGGWSVAETLGAARAASGKVQGRRTTESLSPPIEIPDGSWDVTLQTSWVEPAYLETDASWCRPGGEPATVLANGGAFGGKVDSPLPGAARRLADLHGRPVRALWSREDTVREGPKRPPLAAGIDRAAGRIVVRVARTAGVAAALAAGIGPDVDLVVQEVDVAGPPTSLALRAAGWAEGVALRAALGGPSAADGVVGVVHPGGGRARAGRRADGGIAVHVDAGRVLDAVVLRSYCIGAAHMALGWVTSEGIVVDDDGRPVDLTIRSFGVLRAVDTPDIEVTIEPSEREPVNGSDAVFGAVTAAVWAAEGFPPRWPTRSVAPP
jgi:aerobic-type carbon monoxide dehydrogenase small subunit (CoxS/CutS family)